ncbi:hypothetical protein QVD17_27884 [Tagetes erecta]|uniref:Uncharacterized protein n=1 Tax=Tagetes erecta TaxID=13708 RepID=A0AAD8KA18_TARER|nr:hypothetical protein QVD17_27884 [Tagetes erecta]
MKPRNLVKIQDAEVGLDLWLSFPILRSEFRCSPVRDGCLSCSPESTQSLPSSKLISQEVANSFEDMLDDDGVASDDTACTERTAEHHSEDGVILVVDKRVAIGVD